MRGSKPSGEKPVEEVQKKLARKAKLEPVSQDITERKKANDTLEGAEREKAIILDTMSELVAYQDMDHRVLWVNKSACESVGKAAEELIGRYCYEIWQGRNKPCADCPVGKAWKTGRLEIEEIYSPDGRVWSIRANPVKNKAGNVIGVVEITLDITERKKAEQALQESEQKYKDIFENAREAIITVDLDGRITDANKLVEEYGFKREELFGKRLFDFVPEYDKARSVSDFELLVDGNPVKGEMDVITPKGIATVEYRDNPIVRAGEIIGVQIILTDITERKRAEEALRASHDYLVRLTNSMWDAVFSVKMPERIIEWVNDSFMLIGYEPEECIGKTTEFLYPDRREFINFGNKLKRYIEVGKNVLHTEQQLIRKNGEIFPAEITTTIFREKGLVTRVTSIIRDITERKMANLVLQESEEKFRSMFELSPYSTVLLDLKGNIQQCNQQFVRFHATKEPAEAQRGRNISEFFPPEEKPKLFASIEKTIKDKKTIEGPIEYIMLREDGSRFPAEGFSVAMLDETGMPKAVLGLAYDITERKKAEQLIRKERDKAQKYLDVAAVMMVAIDAEQRVGLINKKGCEILGYSEDEILGKNWFDNFLPERIRDDVREIFDKTLYGEADGPEYYENPVLTKNGDERLIAWHNTILRNDKSEVIATLSSGEDITERRRAEDALRREHNLLRLLIDNLPDSIYVKDCKSRFILGNDAIVKYEGFKCEEELLGKTDFDLYPEESAASFYDKEQQVIQKGQPMINEEGLYVDKQGNEQWVLVTKVPLRDENGKIVGLVGINRNITEHKKAEEALQQEHNLLRLLIDNIPDRIYVKDRKHRFILGNDTVVKYEGFQCEKELLGKTDFELYPEELAAHFYAEEQEVIQKCQPLINKERFYLDKQGNKEWTLVTKVPLRDESGNIIGFVGINRDITEYKKAEESLRKSEHYLRKSQQIAHFGSWVLDVKTNRVEFSDEMFNIFGITREQFSGTPEYTNNLVKPEDRARVKECYEDLLIRHKPASMEYSIIRPDGSMRHLWGNGEIKYDENGNLHHLFGTVLDITERKRAEKALRESEEKFRGIFEHANDGVIYLDGSGNILDVNEKAIQIFGGSKKEVLNRHFTEIGVFSSDEIPILMSSFEDILTGKEATLTVPIKNRKGKEIILECSASLTTTNGQAGNVMVIARDITERQKAAEQIAKLAKFPAEDPNPVLRISGHGTIVYGNKASQPLLKAWDCRIGQSLPDRWHRLVLDALSSGQSQQTEVECDDRIFALTFAPVVDSNYVNVYGLDITERKRAEGELIRLNRVLEMIASINQDIFRIKNREKLLEDVCRRIVEFAYRLVWIGFCDEATKCVIPEVQAGFEKGYLKSVKITFDETAHSQGPTGTAIKTGRPSVMRYIATDPRYEPWRKEALKRDYCSSAAIPIFSGDKVIGVLNVYSDKEDAFSEEEVKLLKQLAHDLSTGIKGIDEENTRIRTEEALRESEEKYRTLIESTTDLVYMLNFNGKVLSVNKAGSTFLDSAVEDIEGKNISELFPKEIAKDYLKNIHNTFKTEESKTYESKLCMDQKEVWLNTNLNPLKDKKGKVIAVIGISRDITEHKKAEQKLQEEQARLKALASELTLTEERERRRIATELHDRISQSLAISKIRLEAMRKSKHEPQLTKELDEVCNTLGQTIADTRSLTFDLSSPILHELGFGMAVEEYVEDQVEKKYGIDTSFEDDDQPKPLDDNIRVLLFRDVRELLVNVVKHAHADKVKVSIGRIGNQVCVSVEDNGVGFDTAKLDAQGAKRGAFGLFSIRERLEQLGGQLKVESEPGRGSKVTMMAPLKQQRTDTSSDE